MKPRLTKAVRDGWGEILAYITCVLEYGEATQFRCAVTNGQKADCMCEGCVAARNAWAAINWINRRLAS